VKIALIVEGKTEKAFVPCLRSFLQPRLHGKMPNLVTVPCNGRIPKEAKLKRMVERLLDDGQRSAHAVIALTDVYTGTDDFSDAADAKRKMNEWVGSNPCFYPHAAQHDFEAWLLPFWGEIQKLAGRKDKAPAGDPENIDHHKPPSKHIEEIFRCRQKRYLKPRDAARILRGQDLMLSVNACPELKSFINTILTLCGGTAID
jgi:hypothetical protein